MSMRLGRGRRGETGKVIVHFTRAGVGTPFLLAAARFERATRVPVLTVLTTRGKTREMPSVRQIAGRLAGKDGLMQRRGGVVRTSDVNAPALAAKIGENAHGIVTYFDQIFAPATIARFATLVNFHQSVLPYYRGPVPTQWVVALGERRSGFTVHDIVPRIDAGPIRYQEAFDVPPGGVAALDAVSVHAMVPVFERWLRHVGLGEPFAQTQIDADAVYRARVDYAGFQVPPASREAARITAPG